MNEQTKNYFRNVYGTYENLCGLIEESLTRLRRELQEYNENHRKGGAYRRKNMEWLKQDIRALEQQREECKAAFVTA